jgi:PBSX family phage terminase large subunit
VSIEFVLNPKQDLAMSTPTRRLLLTGGVRAGKTQAACFKVREIALRMPGSQILVVRKTLKELRDDTFKVFYNPLDGLLANTKIYGELNKSNYEHNLPNGSKIYYRQADDEKKWLGMDLSCIYFEQAENIDKKYFDYALTRLTFWGDSKNPQSRGYRYIQKYNNSEYGNVIAKRPNHFFIMSCNPDTGSWIYDDIIATCPSYTPFTPHIKHPELGWDIINFQTEDNVQLPDVKKYIEEIKLTSSDTHYRRMILGEWIGSEGMIFSHFINSLHIVSDFKYDENRHEIVVGIDPGSVWFSGVIFGAYDKKTQKFIIFDEIKIRSAIIPEIAILIKEKLLGHKINITNVQFLIDHAANSSESAGVSKADQYKQCKIYVVNANKVLDGALERINGYFKQNRIQIVGSCVNLLNDIKSYRYDENGKPNKKAGAMGFDLVDAFRYFINHYAYPIEYKEKSAIPKDSVVRTQSYITKIFNDVGNDSQDSDIKQWGI